MFIYKIFFEWIVLFMFLLNYNILVSVVIFFIFYLRWSMISGNIRNFFVVKFFRIKLSGVKEILLEN